MKKLLKFIESHFFMILFILFVSVFLVRYGMLGYGIEGDGNGYYMYLPSLTIDGDLDFNNQFMEVPWINYNHDYFSRTWMNNASFNDKLVFQEKAARDGKGNIWPIGTAILLSPFFILGRLLVLFLNSVGFNIITNGFSSIEQIFSMIGSIFYGVMGLFISFKMIKSFLNVKVKHIYMAILFTVFGSFFINYITIQASLSHSISFFITTLFMYIYLSRIYLKNPSIYIYGIWGLVTGMMLCVRPQNVIFILVPAILFINEIVKKKLNLVKLGKYVISVIFGLISLSPYFIVNTIIYGGPLTNPQSAYFTGEFFLIPLLFSFRHSLFVSTPIILLCTIGIVKLFLDSRKKMLSFEEVVIKVKPIILISFLGVTIVNIIVNAFISDWFAGDSFGARRFSNILFIFILGLTYLFHLIENKSLIFKRIFYTILFLFVVFNGIYMFDFAFALISRRESVSYFEIIISFLKFIKNIIL